MANNLPASNYGQRNTGWNNGQKTTAPAAVRLSTEDKADIRKIILEDESAEVLVRFADAKADVMAGEGLSTSQLRNLFGEFRKIEAFWEKDKAASKRRLQLLLPKLAYQQKREEKTARFCDIMTEAIKDIFTPGADIDKGFRNCMNLMEAIVAYHKYHGGKD